MGGQFTLAELVFTSLKNRSSAKSLICAAAVGSGAAEAAEAAAGAAAGAGLQQMKERGASKKKEWGHQVTNVWLMYG